MKNNKKQLLVIALLVIMTLLCVPSSLAKYSKKDVYAFKMSVKVPEIEIPYAGVTVIGAYRYSDNPNKIDIELPNNGYYIIIAKGGNGGNGYSISNKDYKIDSFRPGGIGGTIVQFGQLSAGTKLSAYLGSAGGDAGVSLSGEKYSNWRYYYSSYGSAVKGNKVVENEKEYRIGSTSSYVETKLNNKGTAGVNAQGTGLGCAGSFNTGYSYDDMAYVSSGGSGAATIIYNATNLVGVAAGAGAGPSNSYNDGGLINIDRRTSGTGGNGGSNINKSIVGPSVLSGSNGTGFTKGSNDHFGVGGTDYSTFGSGAGTLGGSKGQMSGCTIVGYLYAVGASSGNNGGTFVSSTSLGNGGSSADFGGPGGGGYSGGGGGAGWSVNVPAGGGGGGSSYIGSGFAWDTAYSKIYNDAMAGRTAWSNERDGWIIVAYINGTTDKMPKMV